MIKSENHAALLACIDAIVVRKDCVLSYDRDLIDLLPDMLAENYGVIDRSDIARLPDLVRLFELLDPEERGAQEITHLPELIAASGADLSKYVSHSKAERTSRQANDFSHWSEKSVDDSVDAVLTLQKDLGMGAHNEGSKRYDVHRKASDLKRYLRSVTTPPPSLMEKLQRRSFWEIKLAKWLAGGILQADLPSLSIGPRWVTEIEFFREIVGLRKHIGLDLFTDDAEMVIAGDMHKMPFDDGYFQFIFLKNVVDKSYDVRKLVQEVIRVMQPGGIVVVDQICGYGATTPLTRTDIQQARNLARIFSRYTVVRELVCEDVDISGIGDSAGTNESRNNARLALRLK